jgi:ribose transport system substrate-binding protein
VSVHAGAAAAGQKFDAEILWNGPALETDYDRQMQIVDSMLTQHIDGLAIAAAERHALNRSLDRAAKLGIPVTVFDSAVDSTQYMTFVATDNYQAGQLAGREMARLLADRGPVAMVMNAPGSASTTDRERGFEDVLRGEFPNMQIVARQFSMSDRSKGRAAAENILTAHPDLAGIFTSSELSSTGAALALKSRGLAGKVKLVAFDAWWCRIRFRWGSRRSRRWSTNCAERRRPRRSICPREWFTRPTSTLRKFTSCFTAT